MGVCFGTYLDKLQFGISARFQMSDPPRNRAKVRERIVRSAFKLFNRRGFTEVSIDDIMADAGLTRGGFYSYFNSKSELYAEAVALFVDEKREGIDAMGNATECAVLTIRDYLSLRHFEDVDTGCPLIGLPNDLSRSDGPVRAAQETALRLFVDTFERGMAANPQGARERALALTSLCVGGMVLARSIEDRALADELREAAVGIALKLGGWD